MDDGLIRAYTDGSGQTNLSASASDALYLAIDGNNSKVYWTNISSVVRANLDGSDETTIFSGVSPLEGIDTDYHNPAATPVELTSFTAHFNKLNDQNIILTWQTATEVNNYGFEIERQNQVSSIKNQDKNQIWETIGFVEGHGNSSSPKEYSFTDYDKFNRVVKYRLKQIDTGGQYEYSDILEVEVSGIMKYKLAQNHPNPFNPTTQIAFTIPQAGIVKLNIYNVLGEIVTELVNENLEVGIHKYQFSANNLSSGIYFYSISINGFTEVKKMNLIK